MKQILKGNKARAASKKEHEENELILNRCAMKGN
jgi:hypothetical protein